MHSHQMNTTQPQIRRSIYDIDARITKLQAANHNGGDGKIMRQVMRLAVAPSI